MFSVDSSGERCPRCNKPIPEVGYKGSYDGYCDGACSSAGTPAAPEGGDPAARFVEACRKGDEYFTAAALLKLGEALRRRDAAAFRRISWNTARRLDGEGPAYIVAAAYDIHLGRACATVNGESDLAHWKTKNPLAPACGTCDAPSSAPCHWEER